MKKQPLSIDCHGVLAHFGIKVLEEANRRLGTSFTDDNCDAFYFKDCKKLGEHASFVEGVCVELMDEGSVYGKLDPYPGAMECCRALSEKFDLWVVTHVTPRGVVPVIKWFYDHEFPVKCVFPVSSPNEKIHIVEQTRGIIEDRAKTVNDLTCQDIQCWLVNRPWNANERIHADVGRGTLNEIVGRIING